MGAQQSTACKPLQEKRCPHQSENFHPQSKASVRQLCCHCDLEAATILNLPSLKSSVAPKQTPAVFQTLCLHAIPTATSWRRKQINCQASWTCQRCPDSINDPHGRFRCNWKGIFDGNILTQAAKEAGLEKGQPELDREAPRSRVANLLQCFEQDCESKIQSFYSYALCKWIRPWPEKLLLQWASLIQRLLTGQSNENKKLVNAQT